MTSRQGRIRVGLLAFWAGALACAPSVGASVGVTLAQHGERTAIEREAMASYALPIGPWDDGAMLTLRTEGTMETSAWRIEAPGASTLQLLDPLRANLTENGFDILFECAAQDCGGFDFRYSTTVMPEPEMHVDLGDYRFVAAQRGIDGAAEHVSLLVSRSKLAGFVQMIRITPPAATETALSTKAQPDSGQETRLITAPGFDDLAAALRAGAVVLEGLKFGSGAAEVGADAPPSLSQLATFLTANPEARVALVGHTDTSGSIEANMTVSQRRAEAVRQYLLRQYQIDAARIEAHGVGYLSPRASNATEEGRALNRRVEVVLTSTQ